jgi:hypothetical protein
LDARSPSCTRCCGRGSTSADRWLARADGPDRDERTRRALAEAVAIVAYGRTADGRRALARAMSGEPAMAEPWLRTLVARLNGAR